MEELLSIYSRLKDKGANDFLRDQSEIIDSLTLFLNGVESSDILTHFIKFLTEMKRYFISIKSRRGVDEVKNIISECDDWDDLDFYESLTHSFRRIGELV